jgi:hypothetical protein
MEPKPTVMKYTFTAFAVIVMAFSACSDNTAPLVKESSASAMPALEGEALIKRGEYLVTIGSCHDCHSPKNLTPMGPKVDSTKMFSGHPAGMPLPPFDPGALKPGGWILMAPDVTSFVGPWGVSFAANLTPDSATGIGSWTQDVFINTLRTGKHLGQQNGRPVLPPMPWEFIGKMTDEDLSAVYAYLRTLPAITNRVPAPIPPNEAGKSK